MKNFVLILFSVIMLSACTNQNIGNNPLKDGQDMMLKVLTELKNGNPTEADRIIGEYLEIYSEKDLQERTEFVNGSSESHWNLMAANPTPEWETFFDKMRPLMEWYITTGTSLQSLPNYSKLQQLHTSTTAAMAHPSE